MEGLAPQLSVSSHLHTLPRLFHLHQCLKCRLCYGESQSDIPNLVSPWISSLMYPTVYSSLPLGFLKDISILMCPENTAYFPLKGLGNQLSPFHDRQHHWSVAVPTSRSYIYFIVCFPLWTLTSPTPSAVLLNASSKIYPKSIYFSQSPLSPL